MRNGCQPAGPLPVSLHQASLFEINGFPHDVPCAQEGRRKSNAVVSLVEVRGHVDCLYRLLGKDHAT